MADGVLRIYNVVMLCELMWMYSWNKVLKAWYSGIYNDFLVCKYIHNDKPSFMQKLPDGKNDRHYSFL